MQSDADYQRAVQVAVAARAAWIEAMLAAELTSKAWGVARKGEEATWHAWQLAQEACVAKSPREVSE